MKLPTFESLQDAKNYLEIRARLDFFGGAGWQYEYCLFNFIVRNGRGYYLNLYGNGKVENRES